MHKTVSPYFGMAKKEVKMQRKHIRPRLEEDEEEVTHKETDKINVFFILFLLTGIKKVNIIFVTCLNVLNSDAEPSSFG